MTAIISQCGKYRYRLERQLDQSGPVVSVFMVNPSTADHQTDDATIRKLIGFGKRLGWSKIIVGNLFAYRATDVKALASCDDPFGPENLMHLLRIMRESDFSVVAWGSLNKLPWKLRHGWAHVQVMAMTERRALHCFGICKDGHPKHPVMIGYNSPLIEWKPPQ